MASFKAAQGVKLLQYELLEKIGEGGMGEVWRARDTRLRRDVALKLLTGEHGRVLREARTASALNHPNIVTIHEVNSEQDIQFIVMEYVHGKSLREILAERSLTGEEIEKYAVQVADALGKAHAQGIVHRDVKPSNVMISQDGFAKVVDFGISKTLVSDATAGMTDEDAQVGTPAYMSPEQVLRDRVDARSDVFSFGAMLYEMIRGLPAFGAGSLSDTLRRVLQDDPTGIAETGRFAPIIRRCLQKEKGLRFGNGAEIAAALRSLDTQPRSNKSVISRLAPTAIVFTLLVALVAVLAMRNLRPQVAAQQGVAVLPFTTVNPVPQTQAFSLGLTMATSTHISELEGFQKAFWVVPASDVLQMQTTSVKDARDTFNVDLVVTGSIETSDNRIRVTANISDAHTLRQLRSRQVTTTLGDALTLQDELLRVVGELLEIELPVEARRALHSESSTAPAAEDFLLQGRGFLDQQDHTDQAVEVLTKAVELDPKFALARAALGEAFLNKYPETHDPSWIVKAKASAAESLRLREALPEGLIVLGMIARTEGRYEESIRQLVKAVGITATNRDAWVRLAQAYESAQRFAEAEDAYRKTIALAPSNPRAYQYLGIFFYSRGRYAEAEVQFKRALELAPDNYRAYEQLGTVYLQTNRYPEAEAVFKRSIAIRPSQFAYNNLGAAYFYEERYQDAVPMLEKAIAAGALTPGLLGNLARTYRLTTGFSAKAPAVYQQAFELAGKLVKVNPQDAETLAEIGLLSAETGDAERAQRNMQAALKIAPSSSTVLLRAVMAYELVGNRDKALAACRTLAETGNLMNEINRRPELKSFRSDPKFKEITWQQLTKSR